MVVINHGYKGEVMDVYNDDINDKYTLYDELIEAKPKYVKLVVIKNNNRYSYIKIKEKNIGEILELIKNSKDILVKKFMLFINFLFGSKKHNFKNELMGYINLMKIFKDDINKYTTVKPGFVYNNKNIYGIIFDGNYYIFLERCYKVIEDITFTQETFNKMTREIMETINILNDNNYIHNDLKPNNIILCRNRFKIIDWEASSELKKQPNYLINTKNGNLVFNHPIKLYRLGIPIFMYNYIYKIEIAHYLYLINNKTQNNIRLKLMETFDKVLEKYNSIKYNKKVKINKKSMTYNEINEDKYYYTKLLDYYSFALVVIYLAEKNKLNYNKIIINPILSKFFIEL